MCNTKKNNRGAKYLFLPIVVYVLIWLPSVLLIPYSRYNKLDVFFVNIVYTMLFVFSTILAEAFFQRKRVVLYKRTFKRVTVKVIQRIMLVTAIFSVLGISLLIFDRVVIKGIDYAAGLRAARYQWLNSEVGSTWFGKIGNILIPFSYVSLYLSYMNWNKLNGRIPKWFSLVAGVGVPLIHAMLNGGRSNLLIVLVFLISISVIRVLQGLKAIPFMVNKKMIVSIIIIVIFSYVWSVFKSSADMGGMSIKRYSAELIYALGGEIDINKSSSIEVMLIMLISYAYHGNWVMGQLMQQWSRGYYSCAIFGSLVDWFGLEKWNFEMEGGIGAFLNVPATFYHDFGWAGLITAAILTGVLFGYATAIIVQRNGLSIVELIFIIFIYGYVFLSPMVYVFGLAYFKFVLYAYVVVGIICKIKKGTLDYGFEV